MQIGLFFFFFNSSPLLLCCAPDSRSAEDRCLRQVLRHPPGRGEEGCAEGIARGERGREQPAEAKDGEGKLLKWLCCANEGGH